MSMLGFDSIPQAHVVRKGGRQFAPPRAPRTRPEPSVLGEHLHALLGAAIGLWPLTTVILAVIALLCVGGAHAGP
jgi:hypothetical protein